jgi:hypothetical protein
VEHDAGEGVYLIAGEWIKGVAVDIGDAVKTAGPGFLAKVDLLAAIEVVLECVGELAFILTVRLIRVVDSEI